MRVQVRRCDVKMGCPPRNDAAETRGDGVGDCQRRGGGSGQVTAGKPSNAGRALTSPGRQNVRPGLKQAEAAVVARAGGR